MAETVWRVDSAPQSHRHTIGNLYRRRGDVWEMHHAVGWVPSGYPSMEHMLDAGYVLTEVPEPQGGGRDRG